MNLAQTLKAAQAAGVHLRIEGGALLLEASAPPPSVVVDALARHKSEVVKLLRPTLRPCPLFSKALTALESRCPDYVEPARWRQCIADARLFLARWGEIAIALGWTAGELLGLHELPANPDPSYRRLSRYDCTGLLWGLQGCRVVALSKDTAAVQGLTGNIVIYRKHHKPALGPLGDSLDDLA